MKPRIHTHVGATKRSGVAGAARNGAPARASGSSMYQKKMKLTKAHASPPAMAPTGPRMPYTRSARAVNASPLTTTYATVRTRPSRVDQPR